MKPIVALISLLLWSCRGFTPSTPVLPHSKAGSRSSLFVETDPNSSRSPQSASPPKTVVPSKRRIDTIEQFARLPVWPVWNGVLIFVVSRLFGKDAAAKLEDAIGGRVCPNFFQPPEQTSPFIMLVHHRHSFAVWDPLRYLQRTFFPEGFPAHPHRGFITLTYFMRGGFIHRDSLGIRQCYGAEERHQGKHTQYLMTGSGLLHEEMFDIESDNAFGVSGQELYQLWLNVPAQDKLSQPFIQVLGGEEETPTVVHDDQVQTIVLAGEYEGKTSAARLFSEVSIFHVQMPIAGSTWKYILPQSHATALLYVRKGSIQIDGEPVSPQNTAYLTAFGDNLEVQAATDDADFFFLSGEPLLEPVAAQGSMVMNNAYEINEAYADYQSGKMGAPWSEKLSDQEWKEHVKQFPSIFR